MSTETIVILVLYLVGMLAPVAIARGVGFPVFGKVGGGFTPESVLQGVAAMLFWPLLLVMFVILFRSKE